MFRRHTVNWFGVYWGLLVPFYSCDLIIYQMATIRGYTTGINSMFLFLIIVICYGRIFFLKKNKLLVLSDEHWIWYDMDWTLFMVYGMPCMIFFHVCDGLESIGLMKTLASFKEFIEVHLNRSKILLLYF